MSARTISCALGAALVAGSSETRADDWIGRYAPVSAVCQGLELVVAPGRLSFGDCSRAAFRELNIAQGHAALIDASAAACPIAGNVLTLTPDGPDGNALTLYDDERAFAEGRPKLVCAYSR